MEIQEISARLDTALQKAKGGLILDEYTKSLYLTKAQALFVEAMLARYEYGDALRHVLGSMLNSVTVNSFTYEGIDLYGLVPETDILSILYEELNAEKIATIPLDYNDIHDARVNPFRKPYKKLAYRITGNKKLTIFSTETVTQYFYDYCREPLPIVLEALPSPLNIQGSDTEVNSVLPYDSMLKVIDLAVQEIIKDISILSPPKKEAQK